MRHAAFRTAPFLLTALTLTPFGSVGAATVPTPTPNPHATPYATIKHIRMGNSGHGLEHNVGIRPGRVSSAACNERAASMPQPPNTFASNGATHSSTLVEVPVTGGNVATATRNAQIAENCAGQRH